MLPNIRTFGSRDALMLATAERMRSSLEVGMAVRGSACAALSGGTTPEPAYAALAATSLDWPRVTFALVDERFAPPSDPASNEGMLRRALAPALEHGAKLIPMWSDTPSLEEAAARADAAYAPLYYDIVLMGMGADAHTASWFPGADALATALDTDSQCSVISITAPAAAGRAERLTLTRTAIRRSDRLLLLITGAEKRDRLQTAFGQSPTEAPVAGLISPRLEVFWAP